MPLKSMADMAPIKKLTLGEEAASQIRRLIINGKLPAGTKMVERDICALLDISRTPIRDALKLLEQQGFIRPMGKSLVVCELTIDEAEQFYRLIGNLEQFLMSDMDPVEASTLTKLRQLNEALSKPDNDIEQTINLDSDFHLTLVSHHRNQKAYDVYKQMRLLAGRYDFLFFNANPNLSPSVDEHQQLIDQLTQADIEGCKQTLHNHWIETLPAFLEVIKATLPTKERD
ncbi:MAG: GntR family transcriptional regulator [Psychrosphaera sp.]|nr:GntR family transcriptional regulator [Psychrosphaera sp.]